MAGSPIITCPECGKKFKGKDDLSGRRIRCPFCAEAFVVGGSQDSERTPPRKQKPDVAGAKDVAVAKKANPSTRPAPPSPRPSPPKPSTPKPSAAKPVPPPAVPTQAAKGDDDEDDGKNPYGITNLDLAPRCPNCASEMESEEAVVCLHCGYNTLTREWGKTEKVIATTGGEHFLYLLPGLLAAIFIILQIVGMLYYCLALPYHARGTWLAFTDHESMRVWTTVGGMFDIWPIGYFAFNRLVLKPRPPDKKKD
ncbi:MAG: hypothetical protein FJ271_26750 [Planctomycetes bacterium]|nr:hypothetical protein [Planctomycetota bacterium]